MKLSENTQAILQNFAGINAGIVIQPGNRITTIAPNQAVFAEAIVSENFPATVSIYNLLEFLTIQSFFPDSEIKIDEKLIQIISADGNRAKIVQASENLIMHISNKKLPKLPSVAKFEMSPDILQTIFKMKSNLPSVDVIGNRENILLRLLNRKNPSSTVMEYVVGETNEEFQAHLVAESITKLLKLTSPYTVEITKKYASFTNEPMSLTYGIAIEHDSKF